MNRQTLSLPDRDERQRQNAEALRLSREEGAPVSAAISGFKLKSKKTSNEGELKGHEAFLKALETSAAMVKIEKISSGATISGKVKHSDKFTVSLQDEFGTTRVIFKHDISEFSAMSPRPLDKVSK
jgi:sRNA-binding regulator protein Hfq